MMHLANIVSILDVGRDHYNFKSCKATNSKMRQLEQLETSAIASPALIDNYPDIKLLPLLNYAVQSTDLFINCNYTVYMVLVDLLQYCCISKSVLFPSWRIYPPDRTLDQRVFLSNLCSWLFLIAALEQLNFSRDTVCLFTAL